MHGGPLELLVSSIFFFFFVYDRWSSLTESITPSTIFLKSKVQLLDKTGVPNCYKLKRVKVVGVSRIKSKSLED